MEASRLFLTPVFKEIICSNLTFEDVIRFRDALEIPSLKCQIIVIDSKTQQKIILPGVNSVTIEAYELIKQHGLDLALIHASMGGHNSVVRTLIASGANVEAMNQYGWTALMLASSNGQNEVVQTLIAAKVDVNAVDQRGMTALMWASARDNNLIVQNLIAAGANVEAVDRDGLTALMLASANGHDSVVQTLTAAKAK